MLLDPETLELAPGRRAAARPGGAEDGALLLPRRDEHAGLRDGRRGARRARPAAARSSRSVRRGRTSWSPRRAPIRSRSPRSSRSSTSRGTWRWWRSSGRSRRASSSAACMCTSGWRASTRASGRSPGSGPGFRPCWTCRRTRRTSPARRPGALSSRLARLRRAASRRPAAAAGDGGGLGGGRRRGRRRLHADLVGRASASAARDARGPDRRSGDVRRPGGRARRARPGALRSAAGAGVGRCSTRSSRPRASSARGSSSRRCASRRRRCGSSRSAGEDGLEAVAADLVALGRGMNGLRAALYPLRLVGARLGRRSAPVVLVVLGIAAGASVVLGGRAGTLVAQDRAVAQAVERIPDGQRSVRAVWFGVPGQSDEPQPALDRRARRALARSRRRPGDVARPLPGDHDRRHVRRPRRRRGPRRAG